MSPSGEPSASLAGVTLTLWRGDYEAKGIDAINAGFEASTGAKIQVTKVPPPPDSTILPQWAAGERPDILYTTGVQSTMAKLGAETNLQPLDEFAFVNDTPNGLKDFGVYKGVRYWAGLTAPFINGLLYNKSVMTQIGATLPTNAQELLSFCDQAKSKGVTPIAFGEKDGAIPFALFAAMESDYLLAHPDFPSQLMSGSATFTDPEYVKRIQATVDLKERGCFSDNAEAVDFNTALTEMMADKAAILSCGNNCVPDLIALSGQDEVNAKVGFLPLGYDKPVAWANGAGQFGMFLPKTGDASREAAARAYLAYATGSGYPLYLTATGEESRYSKYPVADPGLISTPLKEASQAVASGLPLVPALYPATVCSYGFPAALFTALAELYVGDKSAQQVAEGMDSALKQSCKDLGIPGF